MTAGHLTLELWGIYTKFLPPGNRYSRAGPVFSL